MNVTKSERFEQLDRLLTEHDGMLQTAQVIASGIVKPIFYALNAGLVLARKPGKLPCESLRYEYALEYGTDSLEIHVGAIKPGQKVVVVDDLLATGGTCLATAKLVEEMGGEVVGARFAIELASECGGRDNLKGYDVYSAIVY